MIEKITVSDFVNTKYRAYWEYSNKNGKNSIDAREQLPEVIRKIIFACWKLKIKEREEHKTTELMGEVGKYHAHGPSSIEDSIKGVATGYKSQPASRILEGIGNFGAAAGDEGAAGRYTSISGTPLLTSIYKDIPFVPMNTDDTGLEQAEYISMPLPISLITGISAIGTGKSCYIAERNAKEIIEWIEKLYENGWKDIKEPEPTSVTGCKTWFNNDNGYVYYEAIVHYGCDESDINKKGRFDIITALPPKSTPNSVKAKLMDKLPDRVSKNIKDGSGKGKPIWIVVPTGYLKEEDFTKYGMRNARKEQIYVWDHKLNTMRKTNIKNVAKEWFDDRCLILTKRFKKDVKDLNSKIHRINLIEEYVNNKMNEWKSEDIFKFFENKYGEHGNEDASLVLDAPARWFLPESLSKNKILKEQHTKDIDELMCKIENIEKEVIKEAYSIIDRQEEFFKEQR